MDVMLLTQGGDACFLLPMLEAEGHRVGVAFYRPGNPQRRPGGLDSLYPVLPRDPQTRRTYRGMYPQYDHADGPYLNPFLALRRFQGSRPGDGAPTPLVLFDLVMFGALADRLRALGYPVYGAGALADRLELNRLYGIQFCEKAGVPVPEYAHFTAWPAALRYAQTAEHDLVCKFCGNTTFTTRMGSPAEMVEHIREFMREGADPKAGVLLQERIRGVEISVQGRFVPGIGFVGPFQGTFEEKKEATGGGGYTTGCAGNLEFSWSATGRSASGRQGVPKLVKLTLGRVEASLLKAGYPACALDMNLMVSGADHQPYLLELTCREGYDAAQCEFRRWQRGGVPIGETLLGMAQGQNPSLKPAAEYGVAVRVLNLPPTDGMVDHLGAAAKAKVQAQLLRGIYKAPLDGVWGRDDLVDPDVILGDVMYESRRPGDPKQLLCAGVSGDVVRACGFGRTPQEARRRAYYRAGKVAHEMDDIRYRDDIGLRAVRELPKLIAWGLVRKEELPGPMVA